jgi:hypothetical protein
MIKVLDANGHLTDAYKQAVAAGLPHGAETTEEFWRELESAVAFYVAFRQRRKDRPYNSERQRWKRIDKLAAKLEAELREIQQRDPVWTDPALAALAAIRRKSEAGVIGYQMIKSSFRGQSNPDRAFFYRAVCDLWRLRLGRELAYPRTNKGEPCGPAVVFFTAVCAPVLGGKMLKASGVGSVIDRERRRAKYFFARQK